MLSLLVLIGFLAIGFGVLMRRRGWKVVGGTFVLAGGLFALLAVVAFIVALLNFHP